MNCINTCWLMIASSGWSICRMHWLFISKFKVWFHVIFFGWCFGRRRARSGFIWRWCNRASRWRSIRKYWVRAASTSWSFKNPIWKKIFTLIHYCLHTKSKYSASRMGFQIVEMKVFLIKFQIITPYELFTWNMPPAAIIFKWLKAFLK